MFIYFAYGEINIKKDVIVLNDNVCIYIYIYKYNDKI